MPPPCRSLLLCLLAALLAGAASGYTLPPANTQCRQVIGDGVAIRFSPSTSAAKEAEALWRCYRIHYLGVKVSSEGLDWAKIWWAGKERWVAAKYLAVCAATACQATDAATCQKCLTAKSLLKRSPELASNDYAAGEGACLAWYESKYSAITHANSDGSTDYGWWQINNRYWCSSPSSPPPASNSCGVACATLLNDPARNALCAAKAWKSGGSTWALWATATKFYCRKGCPCGV